MPEPRREPVQVAAGVPDRPRPRSWQHSYTRRLAWTDAGVVVVAVTGAHVVRFGAEPTELSAQTLDLSYVAVSVVLAAVWIGLLELFRTRDRRVVGEGVDEYRRIGDACFRLFGLGAIVALLLRLDVARGYLAIAFPAGLVGLTLGRWLWRRWLVRQRAGGGFCATVVVVGEHRSAVHMATLFAQDPHAGYRVVGACVPGKDPGLRRRATDRLTAGDLQVPVLGDETMVLEALRTTGADTVAVTATERLGHEKIRALAWQLESLDVDLVVAPGVVDVAGPRLKIRPVAGLPLVHVEEPQYEGASRFGKFAFDLVFASTVLVLSAPVLLVAAVAVKLTSPGPVFYRAERVGINGEGFSMLKLRSMVAGADTRMVGLVGDNEASGPLFKIRDDPRVTRVGRFLRRYSVDELPQLVNVLRGDMSVVGPRPPLPSEVATYTGDVHRRLLVKPGITGLWQVSGRSDLSWEESVRLDLSYVENWSTVQDLVIVFRTARAVLASKGAY